MKILLIIHAVSLLIIVLPIMYRWFVRLGRSYHPGLFEYPFVNSLSFYFHRFREVPCVCQVDDIDMVKADEYMAEKYNHLLVDYHESSFYNEAAGSQMVAVGLYILEGKVIIELSSITAKVLYSNRSFDFADMLIKELSNFKAEEKSAEAEINIIKFTGGSLQLSRISIDHTVLDIGLFYNDDFAEVDELIRSKLSRQNEKGIILLHGLPGTGKTSYLRHLICGLNKRVLFVSPSVAGSLMDPLFIDLLIDHPNSVLVIEDAEKIMMDRKIKSDSSVSNLLNLSDGLLSDCLNVQIICTFNSPLSLVDTALMRKGRLIAMYEFGKLEVPKAQQLSNHFGFDTIISQPMTLAEIANQHDRDYEPIKTKTIGFKREEIGIAG